MEDNNLREPDSSFGSLELTVSLYDNFESSIRFKPDSHDDMPFPSLDQESDHSVSIP